MQKLQSLPYECAKFIEYLTHPDFPCFPGEAKAEQAWGCLEQQHQQHEIPKSALGESCRTSPAAGIWVPAVQGGGLW